MVRLLTLTVFAVATRLSAQNITEYRWWINDDVSTLTTASLIPSSEVQVAATLDLPSLDTDHNTITLQFKDSNDAWGAPQTLTFTRNAGPANGYEFWIDDDIADRTNGAIGPDDIVDLITDLPSGVAAGTHVFTIRFSGSNGVWSVPLVTSFDCYVGITELPGISELLLFPNPANGLLAVRLSTREAQQLDLQLVDPQGRLIRGLPAWSVNGQAHRTWDVSDLAPGNYLLRISDGAGARNLPFVKH